MQEEISAVHPPKRPQLPQRPALPLRWMVKVFFFPVTVPRGALYPPCGLGLLAEVDACGAEEEEVDGWAERVVRLLLRSGAGGEAAFLLAMLVRVGGRREERDERASDERTSGRLFFDILSSLPGERSLAIL